MAKIVTHSNFIKFLGTGGARFVMISQLRSFGGTWISFEGTNIILDPGPGSLYLCAHAKPKLDPTKLKAIILTHRHLDHCADVNVMIEAMTNGGFEKKGTLYCPADAVNDDAVILKYTASHLEHIEFLKPTSFHQIENLGFETSIRHIHPVETYGLKFTIDGQTIAFLTDTSFRDDLMDFYQGVDLLVIYVVFFEPKPGIDHLSLAEAEELIKMVKPRRVLLTHFGMSMLKAKPSLQAENLSRKLGIEVTAAYDGLRINLPL